MKVLPELLKSYALNKFFTLGVILEPQAVDVFGHSNEWCLEESTLFLSPANVPSLTVSLMIFLETSRRNSSR
jgi:hypothetical protein